MFNKYEKQDKEKGMGKETKVIIALSIMGILLLLSLFYVWPKYRVWQREMSGKAQLAEAEWNRKIKIQEAESTKEAAKHLAQAEIERAKGVAEANKIIGASLRENEQYLRYLWIQGLQDGNSEVIYVPTEANLPILEAGKRKDRQKRNSEDSNVQ